MKCIKCGNDLTAYRKAKFCPNCGAPIREAHNKSSSSFVIVLVALIILILYTLHIIKL